MAVETFWSTPYPSHQQNKLFSNKTVKKLNGNEVTLLNNRSSFLGGKNFDLTSSCQNHVWHPRKLRTFIFPYNEDADGLNSSLMLSRPGFLTSKRRGEIEISQIIETTPLHLKRFPRVWLPIAGSESPRSSGGGWLWQEAFVVRGASADDRALSYRRGGIVNVVNKKVRKGF